ncbi:MAG: inositol monophosphatase family protein [Planctomycetota bacterium]
MSHPDISRALSIARGAARAAGAEALRLQAGIGSRAKADGSPVTDGDLNADHIVRTALAAAFPADATLSEERVDDFERLAQQRVWIIDPIDGTRSYVAGGDEWAVQVALVVDGELVLGVLDIPGRGVQVWGAQGLGAGIADATGERPLLPHGGVRNVLAGSASERNQKHIAKVLTVLPEFIHLPAQSIGVKAAQILLGEADLFVHPRPIAEWDAAAPAAVLLWAGAFASDLGGAPLRFNTKTAKVPGLVFSRRADHTAICERLRIGGVTIL